MKIDILTKQLFESYQNELKIIFNDLRKDIAKTKELLMQLQDRIKMLEDKKNDNQN